MNAQAMTERFEMRLGSSVLEDLDSWRARQGDLPSRAEAVRRLVEVGLGNSAKKRIALGDGEKLIVMMLCQLFKHLQVEGDIDPDFVEDVIYGGHYWALDWQYSGLFHSHEDAETVVAEVVDVLDMWSFLEGGFRALSKGDKDRVAIEAEPFGKNVFFTGFDGDGNGEGEHIGIAKILINKLNRFTEFKGRELNSHFPTIDSYRRMLLVFEAIRPTLIGRNLDADEIIQVLQAKRRPSKRGA